MLSWTGYKDGIKSLFIFFLWVGRSEPIQCFASLPTVLSDFIAIICNCIYPLQEWQFDSEVSGSYQALVSESSTETAGWRSCMELWNVGSHLSSCVSLWKLLTQLHSLQINLDVERCSDTNGSHLTARYGERAQFNFHFLAYIKNNQAEQPISVIGRSLASLWVSDQGLG